MPGAEPVRERTDYEIERNKPMPSLNHAIIQGNLLFQLNLKYQIKYSILPESGPREISARPCPIK